MKGYKLNKDLCQKIADLYYCFDMDDIINLTISVQKSFVHIYITNTLNQKVSVVLSIDDFIYHTSEDLMAIIALNLSNQLDKKEIMEVMRQNG